VAAYAPSTPGTLSGTIWVYRSGRVVTVAANTAGHLPDGWGGFLLRAFIGRCPDDHMLRRVVRQFRNTRLARMVFGQLDSVHGGDE
jgi:hypothetical protein